MAEAPWIANEFYQGGFFTDEPEYDITDPLRDQRQAILMEIEGITQVSVLTLTQTDGSTLFSGNFFYYWVSTAGALQVAQSHEEITPSSPDARWIFIGSPDPPEYLVMTDENGDTQYIVGDALGLHGQATPPTHVTARGAQFVGPYLELIGENGIDIYRVTINSSQVVSVALHRTEPERAQSITLQNGHPWAFRNGRTFYARLEEFGDVTVQVPQSDLGYGGIAEPRIGIIRVSLHNSSFDFLTQQDWDGRSFTIWIGSTDEDINLYPIAIRGYIQSAEWDQDYLSFHVRDAGILLDRPLQTNTYAGTGGLDGGDDLEGRVKPLCYGEVSLPEPIEVNKDLHIYQFHDGPIHAITNPHQGLVPLTILGDFPGTLETWQPTQQEVSSGGVRTDLSIGMMRLAAPPGGRVGALQVRGERSLPTQARLSDVIQLIFQRNLPELNIDRNSFAAFANLRPHGIGIYIKEETTVRDTVTRLINSVGGIVSLNRLNSVYVKSGFREEPVAFITEGQIDEGSIQRNTLPNPGLQHRFAFLRTWTQYTKSDFLAGAHEFLTNFALEEYRYAVFGGPYAPGIANRFPNGHTKTIITFYNTQPHIAVYAEYLIHREQAFRDVYNITIKNLSWEINVGDTILLQLSRWGLDVPRMGLIIGVTELSPTFSSENRTTLQVWC